MNRVNSLVKSGMLSLKLSRTFILTVMVLSLAATVGCSDEESSTVRGQENMSDAGGDGQVDVRESDSEMLAEDVVETTSDVADGSQEDVADDDSSMVEPPRASFASGPYGINFRDTAGPFTLTTDRGEWSYEGAWTGRESLIFLLYTNDPNQSSDLTNFIEQLWFPGNSATNELEALIENSPDNVHYFFLSYDQDAATDMARMRADIDEVLGGLASSDAEHWESHLHVVTEPAWQREDWYGDMMRETGRLWLAVDQFQKVRQLGIPQDIATNRPGIRNVAYEALYFDFELRREEALSEETFTVLPVFEGESVGTKKVTVELPSAEALKAYDTMLFDKGSYCNEFDDANCGEWDYLSHLYICDQPLEEPNPNASTSCQPYVAGVDAVTEVLGRCVAPESSCRTDDDCEGLSCEGYAEATMDEPEVMGRCVEAAVTCQDDSACADSLSCEGYVAPVVSVEEVIAETISCDCMTPKGETLNTTQTCNAEGSGYGECACGCGTEIGRWITTYGREGRWVTDVSPMLAMMSRGGRQTLRMRSGNAYNMEFDILLTNRGKGGHPEGYEFLFGGGAFNQAYNMSHAPVEVDVPSDVTRVELVALITGHGWGAEVENCAEFCDHNHHFSINGAAAQIKRHPEAGLREGCRDAIVDGVVPNQYGTWPYGRAGWCPGLDVTPWVVDVTDEVRLGEANTITYQGLFNGQDYVPEPSNSGMGFGANINMSSYLIFWRD